MNQRIVTLSSAPAIATRGRIRTAQLLDREERETYQLILIAQDTSGSPLSVSIPILISVLDMNDNLPMFAQPLWNFTLRENVDSILIMEFNVSML